MLTGRFHGSMREISPAMWDRVVADDQPFLRHAFLSGLEQTGCIREQLGWRPYHLGLYEGEQLVAAAPCYLKTNSHGEFVFDWAWAQAYARNEVAYYPKLIVAVPYTPVSGPRLLVGPADGARAQALRHSLRDALVTAADQSGLSTVHFNFLREADAAALAHDPLLPRFDWQFHWHNQGYRDFADYLSHFTRKKRRNIEKERRDVSKAGLSFQWWHGHEIGSADWARLYAFYLSTFDEKGNTPALTRAFFEHVAATMPEQTVVIAAKQGSELVAAALCFRSATTLYGRYWGSKVDVPGLHFETCYYQGLEYCLAHGLQRFEPGAQGEHKLARGFLPTRIRSAHFVAHPGFRVGIRRSLEQEHRVLGDYGQTLLEHSPFAAHHQHDDPSEPDPPA